MSSSGNTENLHTESKKTTKALKRKEARNGYKDWPTTRKQGGGGWSHHQGGG